MKPTVERFFDRVVPEPNSGCWLWTGGYYNTGYGYLQFGARPARYSKLAHRVSYEIHKGEIPAGLEINHKCCNPACVNPDHLEAVTHRANMRWGNGRAAVYARKTHCVNGHEFTDGNTYIVPTTGVRQCQVCRKARFEKFKQSNPRYWERYR